MFRQLVSSNRTKTIASHFGTKIVGGWLSRVAKLKRTRATLDYLSVSQLNWWWIWTYISKKPAELLHNIMRSSGYLFPDLIVYSFLNMYFQGGFQINCKELFSDFCFLLDLFTVHSGFSLDLMLVSLLFFVVLVLSRASDNLSCFFRVSLAALHKTTT
jgi:hypothetical protein